MRLTVLPCRVAICRLPADAPVPAWAWQGNLCSVTRTPAELSVVTDEAAVPVGVSCSSGWRVLEVAGPLALEMTGVLASLAAPLGGAGISLFAVSTFDTDYILVQEGKLADAIAALRMASNEIEYERVPDGK